MGSATSKETSPLSDKKNEKSLGDILCSEPWWWDSNNWNQIKLNSDGTGIVSILSACLQVLDILQ